MHKILFEQVSKTENVGGKVNEGIKMQFKDENGNVRFVETSNYSSSITDDSEFANLTNNSKKLITVEMDVPERNKCPPGYTWHAGRCREIIP